MKKFITILLLMLLIPLALAIPEPYEMLKGNQMIPVGAPWTADDQKWYFGDDKDGSIWWNTTTGALDMDGLTAYDNTSLALEAGNDITTAGGDSKLDMSLGSGISSLTTGANLFNGNAKVTGTKTFMVNNGAAIFGSSLTAASIVNNGTLTQTGIATFTATPVLNGGATVASGQTLAVTTADKLTVGSVIVPQEMVLVAQIGASEVDQTIFIADDAWTITKIEEVHTVAQNTAFPNTGSLSVTKCTGTTAPGSGTALHNTTMQLNSTVETVVTPTLNAATGALTLADGNRICLNFNGTMTTFAGGCVTIHMKRV